jgi:hypothetical protein
MVSTLAVLAAFAPQDFIHEEDAEQLLPPSAWALVMAAQDLDAWADFVHALTGQEDAVFALAPDSHEVVVAAL